MLRTLIGLGFAFISLLSLSQGHAQSNCERLIRSNNFLCDVKTNLQPGVFIDCLDFSARGRLAPSRFDMTDSRAVYGCTCKTNGRFGNPQFNRSKRDFACTGFEPAIDKDGETVLLPWTTEGRVAPSGRRIVASQYVLNGAAYTLRCKKVRSCDPRSPTTLFPQNSIPEAGDLNRP